ncbi:MAG: tellurite resistance TerB family protein [Geminicoccaceae bacterium]
MVDLNDLLRQLSNDGVSGGALERVKHAMNEGGLGQLGDDLRSALGGGENADGSGASALGDGAQDMLEKAKDMLVTGDKRMIGGIGAALGVLMGGGIKGGIGGAALALLGLTAYNALNNGQSIKDKMAKTRGQDLPVGVRPPDNVEEAETLENTAILALRAMVAAAKADGQIDQRERERILSKMKDAGADEQMRSFVAKEAAAPLDIDALVRDVPDQQTAAQVYAASLLAINVDSAAEREYLRTLSGKLGLDDQVVASLHGILGTPSVA